MGSLVAFLRASHQLFLFLYFAKNIFDNAILGEGSAQIKGQGFEAAFIGKKKSKTYEYGYQLNKYHYNIVITTC